MRTPSAPYLLIALAAFSNVVHADWTIHEASCGKKGDERHDLILAEMPVVVKMAETAAEGFTGTYGKEHYETMMPSVKRKLRDFPTKLKQVFTNIAKAATQKNDLIDYKITCLDSVTCQGGAFAWNNDTDINICPSLLVKASRPPKPTIKTSAEIRALPVDSRRMFVVTNSPAAIILHEMTHFTKVIAPVSPKQYVPPPTFCFIAVRCHGAAGLKPLALISHAGRAGARSALKKHRAAQNADHQDTAHRRTLDYAYGFFDSAKLAAGNYNRQCYVDRMQSLSTKGGGASSHVMCPKDKTKKAEGICPEARSLQNADSYKFIAAPTYWATEGKKAIALPAAKATTKRDHPRELLDRTTTTCSENSADEDMLIDWIMEEPTDVTNLLST